MAFNLFTLMVKLGMDISGYSKGLDDADAKAADFSKKVTSGLANVGGAIVLGGIAAAGAAAAATTAYLASSIQPASDLNETLSKVGVVFGSTADQVIAFGSNAARSMGMTKNAALSAAGTYGNLFRAMGITETKSADMSTTLVGLAADLASFNNLDPTDVLDKLRAGLSGETEPLRSLGVNLNQAGIEAKAMSMKIWDGTGQISAAAKAQASYALILEQTSLAQGDFARTSGGLANQQRIFAASMEDLRARIGTALLPMVNKLMDGLIKLFDNPQVQAGIDKIIAWLGQLSDTFGAVIEDIFSGDFGLAFDDFREGLGQMGVPQWVLDSLTFLYQTISGLFSFLQNNQAAIVGILAALGAAIVAFAIEAGIALWGSGIAEIFVTIAAVMAIVGAAAALLYTAWTQNWGGIQEKLAAVWAFIQPILQGVWDWLSTNIPIAIQALSDYWNAVLLPAIQAVWSWIDANIIPLFKAVGDLVGAVLKHDFEILVAIWDQYVFPALKTLWDLFKTYLWPVIVDVAEYLGSKLGPAFDGIGRAIQGVIGWIKDLTTSINNMSLPSWLTPGSPTPFETGLVGIRREMSNLARVELPQFSAQLDMNQNPVNGITGNIAPVAAQTDFPEMPSYPSAQDIGAAVAMNLQRYGIVG